MEDDLKRKRFLWGVALAWAPFIPMLLGLLPMFSGFSNTRATGLAAIGAGFAEGYVVVGLAATILSEIAALTLLFRVISSGSGTRSIVSVLSICISGLMMILFCLSLWTFWVLSHQRFEPPIRGG